MKQTIKQILPLLVVFGVLVGGQMLNAGWTAPGGAPSSGNNAPAPINVGSTTQLKAGSITTDKTLSAGVDVKAGRNIRATNVVQADAQMRSPLYCNKSGGNCFSAGDVKDAGWGGLQTMTAGDTNSRTWPSGWPAKQPSIVTATGMKACFLSRVNANKKSKYYYNYGHSCYVRRTNTATGEWTLSAYARTNMAVECKAICLKQ